MRKRFVSFTLLATLLAACSSPVMQGHPAAIQAGASVGGVLGSIVGDRAGGYYGSQFGALIGTVAGVAIGNAVSSPRSSESEGYPVSTHTLPPIYEETLANESHTLQQWSDPCDMMDSWDLQVIHLRFIDANRNQVIDAEEDCKLIFDLVNEGEIPVYNLTPVIEEVSGMKHLVISPSAPISSMEVGSHIRYTASIRGTRRLKTGQAHFRVYVSDRHGVTTRVYTFTLPTQKRQRR